MCFPCTTYSASTQLYYRNNCIKGCHVAAAAISALTLFIGSSLLESSYAFSTGGGSLLITLGGGGLIAITLKVFFQFKMGFFSLKEYVESLPPDYVKMRFKNLFPLTERNNGFKFLKPEQISALLPELDQEHASLLCREHIQTLNVNCLVDRDITILFCDNQEGRKRFSYLTGSQVFTLLDRGLLLAKQIDMLTEQQLVHMDVSLFEKKHLDLLFPLPANFMDYDFEKIKRRFSQLSASQVEALYFKKLLSEHLDMISDEQIKDCTLNFFKNISSEETISLFYDPFKSPNYQKRFKLLSIERVHALLPKLPDEAPKLLLDGSHYSKLDPNLLSNNQIKKLLEEDKAKGIFIYHQFKPEHKLKNSQFSLRLYSLKLSYLIET